MTLNYFLFPSFFSFYIYFEHPQDAMEATEQSGYVTRGLRPRFPEDEDQNEFIAGLDSFRCVLTNPRLLLKAFIVPSE